MKKKREKLLQKQNERCTHFKELLRIYVELENRLKAMEEKTDEKLMKQKPTFTVLMVFEKLNRYIFICKWHFLTTNIVSFVKNS